MSETTNQTSAQTPVPGAESAADGQTSPPEGGPTGERNQGLVEARDRYRTERDTAREELTAAQARIERMQRAEVERLASDALSHPADLFSLSGNEPADYLNEAGDVDADKVAAGVAAILSERPGMRRNSPAFDPTQGHGGRPPVKREPTWAAVVNPY